MMTSSAITGMPTILKLKLKSSSMVSEGSSMSATWAAIIVTVQASLLIKSETGSREKVVGPPLSNAECTPPSQIISNQLPLTTTSSLNVISMFASTATLDAPLVGVVVATEGGDSTITTSKFCPVFTAPKVFAWGVSQVKSP